MSQVNVRWKNQRKPRSRMGVQNILYSVDRMTPGGFQPREKRWTKGAVVSYVGLLVCMVALTWLGMHK